jgi:hypothetical protein
MSKNFWTGLRIGVGFLAVVCLFLALSASLAAQTAATGALTGTVTDPTGAVVPNATVTATSVDAGLARTATTGADGVYKFNLLPPGNYSVKFEATGFGAVEVPSATVNVTETAVLNRALQVGSQTQEVSVQADVEAIQTQSSTLGTVVNTQTVTDLPLNTRNYKDLLALSAGANSSVTNATYVGKGSTLIFVNGGSSAQNTFLQDGVVISNWYSLGTGTEGALIGAFAIPNPDTISEFKIQTSTYDAGYGRNPGANVNVVTKTGTNQFHGTAFEFFRNTVLNANDFFNEFSELLHNQPNKELPVNQNQFGGVFGGPVKKDKLFFFTSYQETQQKNGLSGYGYSDVTLPPIPTGPRGTCTTPNWTSLSQCDANTASFVKALAAANCNNAPQQGNVLVLCAPTPASPLANINPVAINILQLAGPNGGGYLIPSPTTTSGFQTFSVPVIFKDHQFLGNFDYVLDPKNTLSARFEWEDDPLQAPDAVINATIVSNSLPGSPIYSLKANDQALLKLTSILSSNLVNEARISYQRFVSTDRVESPYTNAQVGITQLGTSPTLSALTITPNFTLGGYTGYGAYLPEDQFEYADQVSWTHGKHSVRSGFEAERVEVDHIYPSQSIGTLTAATFSDFLIGRCSSGCPATNGGSQPNVSPAGNTNSTFTFEYRVTQLNGFVQDDFKLNSRLTLNLGLRWEYDGFITEKYGNITNIWPSLIQTAPNPGTGCLLSGVAVGAGATGTGCSLAGFVVPNNYNGPLPGGLYKNSNNSPNPHGAPKDDFGPRVGFAWQPTSSDKWVIRGGGGLFYDQIGGQDTADPMSISSPGVGTVPSTTAAPTSTLANPWIFPAVIPGPPGSYGFTPRWVNPANNTSSNLSQTVLEQQLTVPVTYGWNLDTQYEFLPSWVLDLGYVGSHGIHDAATSMSGGQGNATTVTYNQAQLVGVGAPCQSCSLFPTLTTNTTANVPLRVPNLGIAATDISLSTLASYKYNSLQATVRKQFSHGFQLQAAYTWSRAFQSYPEGVNTYPYLAYKYGLNAYYHPQRVVINYVWNLPLGHQQGFMGKVTDGWTVSGVTTIQDGQPMTIVQSGPTVGGVFGVTSGLANFCPGMTNGNIATSGSVLQRVISGLSVTPGTPGSGYLNGGPGYATGKNCGQPGVVFGPEPTVGAVNGVGGGTGYGNSGIGIVLGPGQFNWDMSLAKVTKIFHESQSVEFRGEFFNAFNHPQFNNPSLTASASTFGQISSASVNPRIIQLALKYSF